MFVKILFLALLVSANAGIERPINIDNCARLFPLSPRLVGGCRSKRGDFVADRVAHGSGGKGTDFRCPWPDVGLRIYLARHMIVKDEPSHRFLVSRSLRICFGNSKKIKPMKKGSQYRDAKIGLCHDGSNAVWPVLEYRDADIAKRLRVVGIHEIALVAGDAQFSFPYNAKMKRGVRVHKSDNPENGIHESKKHFLAARIPVIPRPIIPNTKRLIGRIYEIMLNGRIILHGMGMHGTGMLLANGCRL